VLSALAERHCGIQPLRLQPDSPGPGLGQGVGSVLRGILPGNLADSCLKHPWNIPGDAQCLPRPMMLPVRHVRLAHRFAAFRRLAFVDAAGKAVDQPRAFLARRLDGHIARAQRRISVDSRIAAAIIAAPIRIGIDVMEPV